ncbi:MAG: hypothetical protein EOO99_05370 [Pedobacter sp.]|nr:MAG: hypothetical protein EOO99_05370 [Pedobacter sp.]
MKSLKKIIYKGYLFLGIMAFCACGQDDLKGVETISAKKVEQTKDRSINVTVEYSDSAVVKARGFAPVYDKVTPAVGAAYNEMPKGVKIEFFDAFMRVTGSITADYAKNNETEKITIFKRNVVVVNDMLTFHTEELIWDEVKARYTSSSGTVLFKDGTTASGTEFSAPQDFSTYSIKFAKGSANLKEDLVP